MRNNFPRLSHFYQQKSSVTSIDRFTAQSYWLASISLYINLRSYIIIIIIIVVIMFIDCILNAASTESY